jgi:hypothetical protein
LTGSPIADGSEVTKPGRTLSPIGLSSFLFRNNFAKCVGPVQHMHKVVSQHQHFTKQVTVLPESRTTKITSTRINPQ